MPARPAIVRLDESAEETTSRVRVTLEWGEDRYSGEASGDLGEESRPRLIGEATLRAVERVSSGGLRLELAAIATTDLGAARIALAQVRIRDTSHVLVGTALVDEMDPGMATVKAVLDAINRPLGR